MTAAVKDDAVLDRFWGKVEHGGPGDCWAWIGALDTEGYGRFGSRRVTAHRFAWEAERGPIPDGYIVDHLCRNRACVNPAHLEPVTNVENVRRGRGAPAMNARKTHCVRGHLLSGANLRKRRDGRRVCATCARDYHRKYMKARRAK